MVKYRYQRSIRMSDEVKDSLEKIGNEEVDVQILLAGVGGITETDVVLAASNEAFIIGFNVSITIFCISLSC